MFKVHDYVIYDCHGVSQIVDIIEEDQLYYVIQPIDSSLQIKTPVNNERVKIRKIMSKNDVLELIESLPELEPIWIQDLKQRSKKYRQLVNKGDCKDLIRIIKTLKQKEQENLQNKKKFSLTDKDILATATKRLHDEFAFALGLSTEEVNDFIMKRVL